MAKHTVKWKARPAGEDVLASQRYLALSPILVVQGDLNRNRPLVIADGYHRLCAACHADEDAPVSIVLVRP